MNWTFEYTFWNATVWNANFELLPLNPLLQIITFELWTSSSKFPIKWIKTFILFTDCNIIQIISFIQSPSHFVPNFPLLNHWLTSLALDFCIQSIPSDNSHQLYQIIKNPIHIWAKKTSATKFWINIIDNYTQSTTIKALIFTIDTLINMFYYKFHLNISITHSNLKLEILSQWLFWKFLKTFYLMSPSNIF